MPYWGNNALCWMLGATLEGNMSDLQKTVTFWIFLAVIVAGNGLLLFALAQHLFVEPSKDGNWLMTVFATEILGSFVFAWKYFFKEKNNENANSNNPQEPAQKAESEPNRLEEQIVLAGLVKLIPARKYYSKYDSTITNMLDETGHSFTMVSVNLMTGLSFEGLLLKFLDKLRSNESFSITISLINPMDEGLVFQFSKLLNISSREFSDSVARSLQKLIEFREGTLSEQEQKRLNIRVHNSIPFASAIIRDAHGDNGSIQIETKIYKEPVNSSFALEFANGSASGIYQTLVSGYSQLMNDGEDWVALNGKGDFPNG